MTNTGLGPPLADRKLADIPGAVKITSADFNGHSFDGSPFRGDAVWIESAIKSGAITIADVTDRDYAVFDVRTAEGVVRVFPGDQITLESDGRLRVHAHPESLSDWARTPKTP